MRGQDELIAYRKRGKTPVSVFIETDPDNRLKPWRDWHVLGFDPVLLIEESDSLARLDMRCVKGLQVHIDGCDEKRVGAVAQACLRDGATRAISSVSKLDARGEKTLQAVIDSDGEVMWQRSSATV